MEQLLINLLGKAKHQIINGRDFLVAPMSLIVPGVLNGSRGPLLYTAEENAKDPQAWDGMPLVVYHPTANGIPVSGRDPEVIAEWGVGHSYKTKVNNDGVLESLGYFDVEAVQRVDKRLDPDGKNPEVRIYPRLLNGRPIELSTGLKTRNEEPGGQWNGTEYSAIARNYQPDHIAILPDRKGACSITDGCGVGVKNEEAKGLWRRLGEMLGLGAFPAAAEITTSNAEATQESDTSNQGDADMNRKETIDFIVANCDCMKVLNRGDLEKLDEAKLAQLKAGVDKTIANQLVVNAANEGGFKIGEDGKLVANAPPPPFVKKKKAGADDEEMGECKPKTMNEWLEEAPAEARQVLNWAQKAEAKAKTALINRLTANAEGAAKDAAKKVFAGMNIEQLEALAAAMPTPTSNRQRDDDDPPPVYNYGGAAGVGGYGLTDNEREDVLDMEEARNELDKEEAKRQRLERETA